MKRRLKQRELVEYDMRVMEVRTVRDMSEQELEAIDAIGS
jgi:hypothetical protein